MGSEGLQHGDRKDMRIVTRQSSVDRKGVRTLLSANPACSRISFAAAREGGALIQDPVGGRWIQPSSIAPAGCRDERTIGPSDRLELLVLQRLIHPLHPATLQRPWRKKSRVRFTRPGPSVERTPTAVLCPIDKSGALRVTLHVATQDDKVPIILDRGYNG